MKRITLNLLTILVSGALLSISVTARLRQSPNLQQDAKQAGTPAATVKKKNGQIVRGQIKGQIVQETEEVTTKEGDTVTYTQSHSLINGKDIVSIDATGIKMNEGSEVKTVTFIFNAPPSPTRPWSDIYERLMAAELLFGVGPVEKKGQYTIIPLKGVYRTPQPDPKAPTVKILGELKDGKIVPAIEIITATGPVTVPVSEIAGSVSRPSSPTR